MRGVGTRVSRLVGRLSPLAPGIGPLFGRFWSAVSLHFAAFLKSVPGFQALAEHLERAGAWFAGAITALLGIVAGLPALWTKLGESLMTSSSFFSGIFHEMITAVTGGGVALRLGTAVVALVATAVAFVLSGGAPGNKPIVVPATTGTDMPTLVAEAPAGTAVDAGAPGAGPISYADSIAESRKQRIKRLTSETGWLAVAGLYWLEIGDNTFGSDSACKIVLPPGSAPGRCGTFHLQSMKEKATVRLVPQAGAGILLGDTLVAAARDLRSDEEGSPDVLEVGRLQLFVIKRGARYAIRMRDPESPIRKHFTGIDFYPVDPALRVEAKYKPFDTPRKIPVPNIMGYSDSMLAPGLVSFVAGGTSCTLTPVLEDPADSSFFFIFADGTTEIETYGGGRFMYATPRAGGAITLDFNTAYNPPCSFTPFTTCPMPPEGNRLPVAIRAGEKAYAGHEHDD